MFLNRLVKEQDRNSFHLLPLNHKAKSFNAGFSILEAIVATFILGIIGLAVSSMSLLGLKSAHVAGNKQDFESVKWTVRDQVSCEKTLGVPPGYDFSVPVPCTGTSLILKKRDGTNLGNPMGTWSWTASCVANRIQVMVQSSKADTLTNQVSPPKDLFRGIAEGFCSQYFTGTACPTGSVMTGTSNGGPVCSPVSTCPSGQVVIGSAGPMPVCGPDPAATANIADYIKVVESGTQTGRACGGAGIESLVRCPAGWIAASCGHRLSTWANTGNIASNAPDTSAPKDAYSCYVIAGGAPGEDGCFVARATCLNLSKIANGK